MLVDSVVSKNYFVLKYLPLISLCVIPLQHKQMITAVRI